MGLISNGSTIFDAGVMNAGGSMTLISVPLILSAGRLYFYIYESSL